MATRARLDAELVRRGLARSREQARELVEQGVVKVNGTIATKPATNIGRDTPVVVIEGDRDDWASRGAHKLLGALAAFEPQGLSVAGKRCLDAGASTGGFTDVLLRRGAREVVAVDVGYGQLIWRLQNDERVNVYDRTNVRHLTAPEIGGPVDVVVADLSFISLSLVLPAFVACARAGTDFLPMVKPQFEVGKDRVGSGGVVRDPELRAQAVTQVVAQAERLGLSTQAVTASPLPGPSGNVEYFLWLRQPSRELSSSRDRVGSRGEPDANVSLGCNRDATVADTAATDGIEGDALGHIVDPDTIAMIRQAIDDGPQ